MKQRILFLSANPSDQLRIRTDAESREIEKKINETSHRDDFEFLAKFAVQPLDLLFHFQKYMPSVVHFSGHGSEFNELMFQDSEGNSVAVDKKALMELFSALKGNIRIVVLNSCYSQHQAEAIAENIDCVIGMNDEIEDSSATTFAAAFYQAMGFGSSVGDAFATAKAGISISGAAGKNIPVMHCRKGVDPKSIFLITGKESGENPL